MPATTTTETASGTIRVSEPGKPATAEPADKRGRVMTYLLGAPKFHLALIVLLLGSSLVLAVWRAISISNLHHELGAVKRQARAALVAQSGEMLQLSALPLAWAIRAEVLANDVGDIDAYMQKLVHEKYVKRVVFVDATGKIVSSTNTKLKDQPAASALPGVALTTTTPRIEQVGGDLRMVVPVMDFERQIGALVLDYSATQSIDAKLRR